MKIEFAVPSGYIRLTPHEVRQYVYPYMHDPRARQFIEAVLERADELRPWDVSAEFADASDVREEVRAQLVRAGGPVEPPFDLEPAE